MRPHEEILSLGDRDALARWEGMCSDCRGTQEAVLMGIVEAARDSAYGRDHGFSGIRTLEDFRRAVPINEYEDLSGYIDRMADGESDVLFHGPTDYFISTSGTTGKAKLIPEGDVSRDAKNAVNKIRNAYMTRDLVRSMMASESVIGMIRSKGLDPRTTTPQQFADNFHYYSVTSAIPDRKTSGGIDVGFASGKTFESSSFSKGLAYPSEFMGLADGEATMYLTMLFALMHDDVMIVTSNNAARLYARICYAMEHAEEIIRDMRDGTVRADLKLSESERRTAEGHMSPHLERAAELQAILDSGRENFIPRSYWPNLVSARFWLSGSVGVNVAKVRPLLPENTVYYDIGYGASEAKISIPHSPECGYGTLATMSVFYEFVPVEGGEPLTADQLEEGREYELLLTNYGGLYRYMIHDIVKVRGFVGDTPDIEFVTKSREILNIAQEKLPAPRVLDVVVSTASSAGLTAKQVQIYENVPSQRYDVYVELEPGHGPVDRDAWSGSLDSAMRGTFELYDRNRKLGSLNRPEIHLMRSGWQDSLYDRRESEGAPRSQVKLDTRIRDPPEDKWIIGEEASE